jgi:hypothetical protein
LIVCGTAGPPGPPVKSAKSPYDGIPMLSVADPGIELGVCTLQLSGSKFAF